jgi:hypothetical protein
MTESLREEKPVSVSGRPAGRRQPVSSQSVAYGMRWTRLLSGVALVMTAALTAQGCTSTPASMSGNPQGSHAAPAVTLAEARQAFASYLAAVTTDAYFLDEKSLAGTAGVARSMYSTRLRVLHYYHVQPRPFSVRFSKPVYYLPESIGYPRWFVADVTITSTGPKASPATAAEGAPVPWIGIGSGSSRHLVLFEKATATAPWQLASDSRLAPGMSPPALAKGGNDSVPIVPLSDSALLGRPDVTGPLQAAVVDDGPASPAAKVVASGPLTTGLYKTMRTTLLGLSAPPGDVSQWELEGSHYAKFALRTADGGALVFYAMYLNTTVEVPAVLNNAEPVKPGPAITIPPYVVPLLSPSKTPPRAHLEAQQLFSFAALDPPPGAGKIQVIAIGGGLSYASAS